MVQSRWRIECDQGRIRKISMSTVPAYIQNIRSEAGMKSLLVLCFLIIGYTFCIYRYHGSYATGCAIMIFMRSTSIFLTLIIRR